MEKKQVQSIDWNIKEGEKTHPKDGVCFQKLAPF